MKICTRCGLERENKEFSQHGQVRNPCKVYALFAREEAALLNKITYFQKKLEELRNARKGH